MFTDCPNCRRQFRITARHLSAAAGDVRCGFCGTRFSALQRLHDAPLEQMSAAEQVDVQMNAVVAEPEFDIAFDVPLPAPTPDPEPEQESAAPAPRAYVLDELDDPRRRFPWAWASLALLLAVMGVAQAAWYERDALLRKYPDLRPHVERLCERWNCAVLRQRDLGAISVINRDVREHPRYQNALLVNATISNSARFAQPYPHIQLALSDTSGRVIAAREFAPGDYLDRSIDQQRGMTPGAPVHVVLEIVEAGADAASFEIGFK